MEINHKNLVPPTGDIVGAQLDAIIAGGQTKRYHTVHTIKENTVGQHSYGVAMLCWLLQEGEPSAVLIMAALTHDVAEQWTGDMPAPAKRALGIRTSFAEVEANCLASLHLDWQLDANDSLVLKLADSMEGLLFCITERRLGNVGIQTVYENFNHYVHQLIGHYPATSPYWELWQKIQHMWEAI